MLQDVLWSLQILSRQIIRELKALSEKAVWCYSPLLLLYGHHFSQTASCSIEVWCINPLFRGLVYRYSMEVWCTDPLFPKTTSFSFSVNGLAPPGRLKRQKNRSGIEWGWSIIFHSKYSSQRQPWTPYWKNRSGKMRWVWSIIFLQKYSSQQRRH